MLSRQSMGLDNLRSPWAASSVHLRQADTPLDSSSILQSSWLIGVAAINSNIGNTTLMMQGWIQTLSYLQIRLGCAMEGAVAVGLGNFFPGIQASDQTASEALSNTRAEFQNVSCLLSHACCCLHHACFCRGSQGCVEHQILPCH